MKMLRQKIYKIKEYNWIYLKKWYYPYSRIGVGA